MCKYVLPHGNKGAQMPLFPCERSVGILAEIEARVKNYGVVLVGFMRLKQEPIVISRVPAVWSALSGF